MLTSQSITLVHTHESAAQNKWIDPGLLFYAVKLTILEVFNCFNAPSQSEWKHSFKDKMVLVLLTSLRFWFAKIGHIFLCNFNETRRKIMKVNIGVISCPRILPFFSLKTFPPPPVHVSSWTYQGLTGTCCFDFPFDWPAMTWPYRHRPGLLLIIFTSALVIALALYAYLPSSVVSKFRQAAARILPPTVLFVFWSSGSDAVGEGSCPHL